MIHVAVAVIVNDLQQVLITRRHQHQHQGNLWEFPGGKCEPGEQVIDTLKREILEEVGLSVMSAEPLIKVPFDYGDRQVLLDVWRVSEFVGDAQGREGQAMHWCDINALEDYDFPAANQPIIAVVSRA
ncbi:hypothetical protein MPL1_03850 [Methylophaga lonarensis MPL]|uniref:8-oxo-dGTP diphosphatase n=1 Tax=Methylophaga lonarensis MPL TaxID=1286106 RepID=M7NXW2_9GAMM|nr:8-oxo-dGTP diphosphatase MutT [Methylophaga lonarensis]EMR13638.1 hypothetical protein MPL1_03850 [Methylophaga lonarensis MPL]